MPWDPPATDQIAQPAWQPPASDRVAAAWQPPASDKAAPAGESLATTAALAIPRAIGREAAAAWGDLKADFQKQFPDLSKKQPEGFWDQQKAEWERLKGAGRTAVDAFKLAMSPISGAFEPFVKLAAKGAARVPGVQLPGETREQAEAEAEQAIGTALFAARPGAAGAAKAADLVPAVRTPEGLKVGKIGDNHDTIVPGAPEEQRGFVRQSKPDEFLTREQAAKIAPQAAGTAKESKSTPESLSSEDLNRARGMPERSAEAPPPKKPSEIEEGPLREPPQIGEPRRFEDQLFQLRNLETSDRLDALQAVQKLPESYTPELDEKFYHHEEDPAGVRLTPDEQKVYDQHVKPIRTEATALARELDGLSGLKPDLNDIYTPRYVAGRTRSYGEAIAQWFKGVEARFGGASTRTMRKTVDAQKGRDFFIAEHPETGDRVLVYVAPNRDVLAFDGSPQPKPFGRLAGSGGPRTNSQVRAAGETYRLAQATTREIEAQAQTRYIKSVMANRLDNLAKLRSAVRNARFLEALKSDPQFQEFFRPRSDNPVPPTTGNRRWRIPQFVQFQGYWVEPRIADALDDFARTSLDADGLNRMLQNIGRLMNGVMFLNPLPHERNILNWSLITRGLVGNIARAPSTVRNLIRAFYEVHNAGPIYRRALKAGLSLPYSRMVAGDLHDTLIMRLGAALKDNPSAWDRMAMRLGYPGGKIMLKRWAQVPNRVLWASQDVTTLQRMMELQERGIPIEEAVKQTGREIPSYRVPGQVLGSRSLSQLFGNPAFGRFGRYQFNRFQIYADMLRNAFGPARNVGERAHAFDQLVMLGVYTFLVYPMYDWLWQQITGNPLAYSVRAGASAIPYAAQQVAQGTKRIGDVVMSMFTLGIPMEISSEVYFGRYGWSGQPIIRDADVRAALHGDRTRLHQVARDITGFLASELSTLGQLVSPAGRETAGQIGMQAIGVMTPTPEQMQRKERAIRMEERESRRRAYRQEEGR